MTYQTLKTRYNQIELRILSRRLLATGLILIGSSLIPQVILDYSKPEEITQVESFNTELEKKVKITGEYLASLDSAQTYFKNLLEERTNLVSTQSYKDAIELQSHRAKVADIISGILLSSGFVTGIAASFVGRNRKKDVGDS